MNKWLAVGLGSITCSASLASAAWLLLSKHPQLHDAELIFKAMDTDGDNVVSFVELKTYLCRHGIADKGEIQRIFEAMDSNEDGSIGLEEFRVFHDHMQQSFAVCLWDAVKYDPIVWGSCFYFTGAVFAVITRPLLKLQTEIYAKMGQLLFVGGGVLFVWASVSLQVIQLKHQRALAGVQSLFG